MTDTLSGYNLFDNGYEPDLPYRKLICGVIKQAFLHARGLELDADGKPTKLQENSLKATAIEYLNSRDFELDCEEYLNLPCNTDEFIRRIRAKIEEETYQMSISKEAIIEEYDPKKVTQKELAKKYGVSQHRISKIVPKRKRITERDVEVMREKYSYHGMQLKDIAKEYGYSQTVICQAINGTYAHMAGIGKNAN